MSTEYKGKVYVLHIKHSADRDWESDDLVYAIANDGGKGFSYSDFKRACFLNKRFFLAKKAGKDEKIVVVVVRDIIIDILTRNRRLFTGIIIITNKLMIFLHVINSIRKGQFLNLQGTKLRIRHRSLLLWDSNLICGSATLPWQFSTEHGWWPQCV